MRKFDDIAEETEQGRHRQMPFYVPSWIRGDAAPEASVEAAGALVRLVCADCELDWGATSQAKLIDEPHPWRCNPCRYLRAYGVRPEDDLRDDSARAASRWEALKREGV